MQCNYVRFIFIFILPCIKLKAMFVVLIALCYLLPLLFFAYLFRSKFVIFLKFNLCFNLVQLQVNEVDKHTTVIPLTRLSFCFSKNGRCAYRYLPFYRTGTRECPVDNISIYVQRKYCILTLFTGRREMT
jgi:hypothetical protein